MPQLLVVRGNGCEVLPQPCSKHRGGRPGGGGGPRVPGALRHAAAPCSRGSEIRGRLPEQAPLPDLLDGPRRGRVSERRRWARDTWRADLHYPPTVRACEREGPAGGRRRARRKAREAETCAPSGALVTVLPSTLGEPYRPQEQTGVGRRPRARVLGLNEGPIVCNAARGGRRGPAGVDEGGVAPEPPPAPRARCTWLEAASVRL
jgi:hypothetical protein